ncbi:TIGR02611 family protein [Pedococcus dokdonensis]|uniref:TIGR02611 family protein n=1 Tax=Pedococcus dokdonensis TaxID=443156 RepID=A0A1H0NC05_9MICO|nr:TIGR02611 family protein [Pedococcus dokdonensis]SDO90173.1 TIGR02611 family protein [Pedococcus dokdonensis]
MSERPGVPSDQDQDDQHDQDDQRSGRVASDELMKDEDWEWRRRIRSNPAIYPIYRVVVIVLGLAIAIVGLALVPLPGPGWLIVFAGIAILGSEFEPAQRLLDWAKARLHDWTQWLAPKPLWFKGLVGLVTLALVLAIFYGLFLVSGVPGFFPDAVEDRIKQLPGL